MRCVFEYVGVVGGDRIIRLHPAGFYGALADLSSTLCCASVISTDARTDGIDIKNEMAYFTDYCNWTCL